MIKNCVVCGNEFETKSPSKTCSEPCSKEHERMRRREWYLANSAKVKENSKKWHATHPTEVSNKKRRHRLKNRKKECMRVKKWYASNSEKAKISATKRHRRNSENKNFINLIKLSQLGVSNDSSN